MSIDRYETKRVNRRPAVILAVCVLGGAVWLWEGVIKDRVIPKRWSVVAGHRIYRSGQLSAALVRRTLEKHRIQVIVALVNDPQDKNQAAEERAAREFGIELRRFPLSGDGTGDIQQYADALTAVLQAERQGKPVLVHCAAGAQRTGALVAFYQLLIDKKSPPEVVRELRRHGWSPRQNPVLLSYINENLACLATILYDRGLLDEIPRPLPVLPAM